MRFVDTNILLYSVSTDPQESRKVAIAGDILESEDLALSVQVLQEFYVQATHPKRGDSALPDDMAMAFVETWLRFPVQETSVALMQAAASTKRRWRISYWDAAIIEAARLLGCREVLSEDLGHRQDFGGVVVVNPFADPAAGA